jgi:DNA-binding response OmpR family regulator
MTAKGTGTSSGIRLLLVDDDKDTCEALAGLLESSGYKTTTAATVEEGFRRARENEFDLIILDNWFKDGSGVELCKQIRKFDAKTPILFYSAAVYDKDIIEGLRAGAQWYIAKPNLEQFQEALAQIFDSDKPSAL